MFSWKRSNQLVFKLDEFIIKLTRESEFRARLSFVDSRGIVIPPPVNAQVISSTGDVVPKFGNDFPIAYLDSYKIMIGPRMLGTIMSEPHHVVYTPYDVPVPGVKVQ